MKAGLTQAEMDKMSLSELQKAVDKAKNKTEIEKTIADIKVLNPDATGSNGTALSDMTLDELKALLSALQQERATLEASAKAAGMTADEIKKYPSNAALQQAINEKQKAQREDLIKQIQKYDPSYDGSNKTLEQLVADRLMDRATARPAAAALRAALRDITGHHPCRWVSSAPCAALPDGRKRSYTLLRRFVRGSR